MIQSASASQLGKAFPECMFNCKEWTLITAPAAVNLSRNHINHSDSWIEVSSEQLHAMSSTEVAKKAPNPEFLQEGEISQLLKLISFQVYLVAISSWFPRNPRSVSLSSRDKVLFITRRKACSFRGVWGGATRTSLAKAQQGAVYISLFFSVIFFKFDYCRSLVVPYSAAFCCFVRFRKIYQNLYLGSFRYIRYIISSASRATRLFKTPIPLKVGDP